MKKNLNTVFITRTKRIRLGEGLEPLIREVSSAGIKDIYIISEFDEDRKVKEISNIKVKVVLDEDSTSPTAINSALKELEKKRPGAFLVCSKEVNLEKKHIEELEKNLRSLLAVGYKFHIKDSKLNEELQDHYKERELAYRVPWNTCAIWNYQLFSNKEHGVEKFDKITHGKNFPRLLVSIDNKCEETDYWGMEDGLAIAKVASHYKGRKKLFKLLSTQLDWEVEINKVVGHRKKLARKEIVLGVFMAARGYSVEDLVSSERQ